MSKEKEKQIKRAAQRKERAEKEISRLIKEVPEFLRKNGPTPFNELTKELGATTGRLSQVGRMLEESGVIHRYRLYPGFDSRRMWSLEKKPATEPKPRPEARQPGAGMSPEDMAWIEQQQRNAAERRARFERMKHL